MGVASPCIDVCRMDGRTGYCTGCLRTAEEIRRWRKLTDHQCRRVLEDAKRRRARLGRAVQGAPVASP
jgi:predicted Fe-S protein YdhL (DUF1289 family)